MLIVATAGVSELHCTVPLISCVLPSVKMPVAMNCCVVPSGIEGIAGVTAMETRTAGETIKVAEPEIAPTVAVIPVLPMAPLVANPCALTVAIVPSTVCQLAELVRSKVLPSE